MQAQHSESGYCHIQILQSDNPDHGFQFPGVFELSAMGAASAALERELPALLEAAGVVVRHEEVAVRASSGGRFVSVRIVFEAKDRAQHDAARPSGSEVDGLIEPSPDPAPLRPVLVRELCRQLRLLPVSAPAQELAAA